MYIAVGSDAQTALTDAICAELQRRGHQMKLHGALTESRDKSWPNIGMEMGNDVASGKCDEGIMCCYTGTGASIATNKVPGVRAALCVDAQTAAGARQYNHANMLCLSLRLTSPEVVREILDAWFSTQFGSGEDAACVARINEMDRERPYVPSSTVAQITTEP